jgi:RNA polymerase sigma-54 factor
MKLFLAPQLETRITPALLTLTHMLALPVMELQQLVQQELSENPALEELEADEGSDLDDETLLRLLEQQQYSTEIGNSAGGDDEAHDPLLFVAAPQNLEEYLLSELHTSLPAEDYPIAGLLMASLDDNGFLEENPVDLAHTLGVNTARVRAVIDQLQQIGPPGIASRDLRECLLLQIAPFEQEGTLPPHTRTIIAGYLDELGAHRDRYVAQQLGIDSSDVAAVREFVRRHCHPYPAQLAPLPAGNRPRYSQPDVLISLDDEDRFQVEVLRSPRRMLRLNPLYREMVRRGSELNEDEREHVQEYLARARTFLANLRQRESTLKLISEAIVQHQEAFLRHGVRHLQPLTRATIAAEVGVHESTVSRTTAGKTALLPDRHLLPFSEFFVAARPVQDVLREIINNETVPLSDSELARILNQRGYPVARRTVAKYRDQMQILPSTLRIRR